MPDWLIEGSPLILLLVGVAALCAGVAWWKTRKPALLATAIVAFTLAIAFVAMDRIFESDSEQIRRKVTEMAAHVKRPIDLAKIFNHISADFKYGNADKMAFRKFCESAAANRQVNELIVWSVVTRDVSREGKRGQVSFQFKVKADAPGLGEGAFFRCRAEFGFDPDQQWRMKAFKVFALNAEDQQLNIPGLD